MLKMLNRQSEIHSATNLAFESDVILHHDMERNCSASRVGLLHGECSVSISPRRAGHASVAFEEEKFRFAQNLFRSA